MVKLSWYSEWCQGADEFPGPATQSLVLICQVCEDTGSPSYCHFEAPVIWGLGDIFFSFQSGGD